MLTNSTEEYRVTLGDCIPALNAMPDQCIDMALFSPPFPSLYAFSSMSEDIGNSEDLNSEAKLHLSWFYRRLARVIKPGRVCMVHVMQIPRMKRAGGQGLFDFRGLNIRLAERAGLIFEYDWAIRRNPQAQAITTRSRELQFAGLESDRARSRGALPDYLLKFTAPGDNKVPVEGEGDVSRKDWIEWAECTWTAEPYAVNTAGKKAYTLNTDEGKGCDDTRHICVARDSLVLTRDGYIPIQDVEVGARVLTHRGRWQPVIAKTCNGIRPVIQTEAQGVPRLITTPDHLLYTRRCQKPDSKAKYGFYRHRTTAQRSDPEWMQAGQTLGSYVNLTLPPVEDSEYSAHDWWIIGRWLGDGHLDVRGQAHLSCSNAEIGELVGSLGARAGAVTKVRTGYQIAVSDCYGHLRELLRRCRTGAGNKRLPAEAITLDAEKAQSLLSGYLSADGCYVARYQRWTASSISRSLLLGMALVAQRARGVVASVYAGRPPGTTTIEGRMVRTRQDWILSIPPKNMSGFIVDDAAWKKVRQLRTRADAEVWDLQVAEDESFTVEGCVVHNCPLQLSVIDRLVRLYTNPGELVLSPFAGIGSEGFVSLLLGRRFCGIELKPEYHATALRNLERAVKMRDADRCPLFAGFEDGSA